MPGRHSSKACCEALGRGEVAPINGKLKHLVPKKVWVLGRGHLFSVAVGCQELSVLSLIKVIWQCLFAEQSPAQCLLLQLFTHSQLQGQELWVSHFQGLGLLWEAPRCSTTTQFLHLLWASSPSILLGSVQFSTMKQPGSSGGTGSLALDTSGPYMAIMAMPAIIMARVRMQKAKASGPFLWLELC